MKRFVPSRSIRGRLLWEYKLPAAAYATPSTYMFDGRQYLVVAAGGGGKNGTKSGDSVVAFALPEMGDPSHRHRAELGSDQQWIELFDGRTLQGWVHLNGSHTYSVEDGAIAGRTVAGSVNSFLCTTREFGDFELELDVYVDEVTNSGIQFRSRARPTTSGRGWSFAAGRVFGPQVEIRRNQGQGAPTTGMIYGEALGTGWLSNQETIDRVQATTFTGTKAGINSESWRRALACDPGSTVISLTTSPVKMCLQPIPAASSLSRSTASRTKDHS